MTGRTTLRSPALSWERCDFLRKRHGPESKEEILQHKIWKGGVGSGEMDKQDKAQKFTGHYHCVSLYFLECSLFFFP